MERIVTDGGDRVGDGRCLAANNQCIARRLDDGVAIVTGIIFWIVTIHYNARQVIAEIKWAFADESDRVGNYHTCQVTAVKECKVADGGNRVGDVQVR